MTDPNRDGHASHALHGGVYPGNLFMVIAPSGAGKSTLVNALLSKDSDICLSISYTTRKPRPGERKDTASRIFVLPAPFAPHSTIGPQGRSVRSTPP